MTLIADFVVWMMLGSLVVLPLAGAYRLGRWVERRLLEREIGDEAEAWLEERLLTPPERDPGERYLGPI